MESLTGVIKKACEIGIFSGINIGRRSSPISHFIYADDVIFLGEWSLVNALNLKRILRCFYLVSGLKVNLSKSNIFGIGVDVHNIQCMADLLGCARGSLPFKYLGLLVGANMNRLQSWEPVVEVFRNKLSAWKSRLLSHGGRITLLKSVLNALPTYYFSIYKAPIGVIKLLEKIRREFFWGDSEDKSRIKWIAWKKFISPKEEGGMDFGSLRLFNLSLLAKWWWRLKTGSGGLWSKVILSIHYNSRSCPFIPLQQSITGPWKQIAKLEDDFAVYGVSLQSLFVVTPGKNSSARFWLDTWLMDTTLSSAFPSLFLLETSKNISIKDRVISSQGFIPHFAWARPLLFQQEQEEFAALGHLLSSYNFVQSDSDDWSWTGDRSRIFSVSSLKRLAAASSHPCPSACYVWNNWAPIKVNFFAWRVLNNGIPTASALARRGINHGSIFCPLCEGSTETTIHLLGTCPVSSMVWDFIAQWCRIQPVFFLETPDLISLPPSLRGSKSRTKAVHLIFLTTLWSIWRHRNSIVFEGKRLSVDCIIGEIKSLGFLWIRNRAKLGAISWEEWVSFTFAV